MKDALKNAAVHLSAMAITFTDIENAMKLISLALAIIYTSIKIYNEYKPKKDDEEDTED